jgi:predicted GIY-YIG superfamily endonuclease
MATYDIDPRDVRRMADMHAVYRMFDGEGRLLYIGRTGDAGRRFGDHTAKRWFPLVETIKLEWLPTEAAAVLAERRAIRAERPRYNIAETPKSRSPVRPAALTAVPPERAPRVRLRARPAPRPKAPAPVPRPPRPPLAREMTPEVRAVIVEHLSGKDGTTTSRIGAVLGVNKYTSLSRLRSLRDEGIARVCGEKKGARWRLVQSGDGS